MPQTKSMTLKMSLFLGSVSASMVLGGCSQTSTDTIKDAQTCLNKATSATAQTCYNMVSGLSSSSASLIRCSAIFVRQGFTSPTLLQSVTTAFQGTGTNATVLNLLAFRYYAGSGSASNATDQADATDANTQCVATGSAGLTMLASLASIATVASSEAGATQTTAGLAAAAHTNASTIANTGTTSQTLLSSYQQNCTGSGASSTYQSMCTQYAAAISATSGGTNNPTGVATYFLTNLQ